MPLQYSFICVADNMIKFILFFLYMYLVSEGMIMIIMSSQRVVKHF